MEIKDCFNTASIEAVLNSKNIRRNNFFYLNDNGILVPRVTNVLRYAYGEREEISYWAAKVGYGYYKDYMEQARDIGDYVHKEISIIEGFDSSQPDPYPFIYDRCKRAVSNYHAWKKTHQSVIFIWSEKKLICNWYGGTADALVYIDGKIYLVDFKTSKSIVPQYFSQLAAYWFILTNTSKVNIDGVMVLRLDKEKDNVFEEAKLDFNDVNDVAMFNHCKDMFFTALYMFYLNNLSYQDINKIVRKND